MAPLSTYENSYIIFFSTAIDETVGHEFHNDARCQQEQVREYDYEQ